MNNKIQRGRRPDGTYEIWIHNNPNTSIPKLGRISSLIAFIAIKFGRRP